MSYSISTLLTRNLQEVFGENDPARRRAAVQELHGRHQLRLLPEHGPGASARTARRIQSTRLSRAPATPALLDVEVRDLALYEALTGDTEIAAPRTIVAPGGTTEPTLAGAEVRG